MSFQSAHSTPATGNPSFKTAHSTLSTSGFTQKDFSYLLRPEIYHSLTLLDVPPPFRTASSQPDPATPLNDLVSAGHFRSAAIKAAQALSNANAAGSEISPNDHEQIFSLFYTRLACLTLCNQTALAAQEVKALEDLNSSYYRNDETGVHLVPWELRVLAVRLQGIGFNDARRGVMGYYDLAREARLNLTALKQSKLEGRDHDGAGDGGMGLKEEIALWEQRLGELGVRVASALVEMEDLEGATRHLRTLESPAMEIRGLAMQKALLWFCLGDVDAARSCFPEGGDEKGEEKVVQGLAAMADGEYGDAVKVWEELIASSMDGSDGEMAMYRQNLGVCLLYLGKMDEVCLFFFPLHFLIYSTCRLYLVSSPLLSFRRSFS